MQNRVIAIGGLETAYMRKLALYLSNRLEEQARVAIVGEQGIGDLADAQTVWVGSQSFVEQIREQVKEADCMILAEEESEEESVVCRYQPAEKIYQRIMFLSRRMRKTASETQNTAQKWVVVTTDSAVSQLLAFSLTAAEMLQERGRVIYLNLTACSGMELLFQSGQGVNLSDLMLAIRADTDVSLQAFVRRMESLDCIFPPDNPSVLCELREEDILELMTLIQAERQYTYVVVALGNACCGCELFFRRAATVIHLTREGEVFASCTEEWMRFIRFCLEPQETQVRQVVMPPCRMGENGIHLLYEWRDGLLGELAGKYLEGI